MRPETTRRAGGLHQALSVGAALILIALAAAVTAEAQDLEPRAYANTPVGINFLVLGYAYTHGDVAFDSSAPIKDAELTVHTAYLAYARSLDLWGHAGKLEAVLPWSELKGTAKVFDQPRDREVSGLGDPRLRLSVLLYGGPALTMEEYAHHDSDLIIGAGLAVSLPLGQYETRNLVNLGTNRWSFRPEIGISKSLGPFTLELIPSVTFYTDNRDFFRSTTLHVDPLYAVQGHVIYLTRFGLWVALDATYYAGGRPSINGKEGERLEKVRAGGTIAIPVDRHNSIKLYGSTGAVGRADGSFDAIGIAWQYRWGGGL